jgi:hypothetical protein
VKEPEDIVDEYNMQIGQNRSQNSWVDSNCKQAHDGRNSQIDRRNIKSRHFLQVEETGKTWNRRRIFRKSEGGLQPLRTYLPQDFQPGAILILTSKTGGRRVRIIFSVKSVNSPLRENRI